MQCKDIAGKKMSLLAGNAHLHFEEENRGWGWGGARRKGGEVSDWFDPHSL